MFSRLTYFALLNLPVFESQPPLPPSIKVRERLTDQTRLASTRVVSAVLSMIAVTAQAEVKDLIG